MAPSRKRRREKLCAPETPLAWTLPVDILLEIVARLDLRTLVRYAATCKLLRRDLLSPPFVHRVRQAAPCILAHLSANAKKSLTLVHPTTPATSSFCHNHLSPFLSRKGIGSLLYKYKPLSSRRGLVILHRINNQNQPKPDRSSYFCVYDPMSSAQTFFSKPPEIVSNDSSKKTYVLLTAADGIDDSLMLVIFDIYYGGAKVHTASSRGTWETVTYGSENKLPWRSLRNIGNPAILRGVIFHWIACLSERINGILRYNLEIQSYNLGTGKTASMKLPTGNYNVDQLHLATSSDIKLLKLLAIQGFKMFVWIKLSDSIPCGSVWSLENVIDMKENMRSLVPSITGGPNDPIKFEGSGKRTGHVVFLVVHKRGYLLDLETNEMHRKRPDFPLLEIDLPSRLQTMKVFS